MQQAFRACATAYSVSRRYTQQYVTTLGTCTIRRQRSDSASKEQSHPFHDYYADLLDAPLHSVQATTRTAPAPGPTDELRRTEKEEQMAKARVVFGSRLAGPADRRAEIKSKSQVIAGILVPSKPIEPDNCCMSGCVNCVWDRFRDELEEWAAKSTEAGMKLLEQRSKGQATGMMATEPGVPSHVAVSMDDDGGGRETNWSGADGMRSFGLGGEDLFANVPVGIREFMKTEKRLKEKRKRESTVAG